MEVIAQLQETSIYEVLFPTIYAFTPLLEPMRTEITGARKTFKYGETERHQLDVYCPPPAYTGTTKHPLLVFIYGGNFTTGKRTRSAPADLVYGNVGCYFASHGFITIIPDYRLAPETPYPGGAEDLRAVLEWTASAARDALGPAADRENIFLLGHSAGGVHVMTMLFREPTILASGRVKGAFIAAAPMYYDFDVIDEPTARGVEAYYGARTAAVEGSPLTLFRAASEGMIRALPPLALLTCERDPEYMRVKMAESRRMLEERGIKVPLIVAKGHNHVSITFALGTGQGEEWAEDAVRWMRAFHQENTPWLCSAL
ncbi:alpha/beta-hydrolase [Mycena albidolilacea]|uniref:Alpha/beta-hydrolase n=1 Tax=Mycena albidolilacea TaxID=1033008 RepID=A0AAD7EHN8_9AGAR|nr:alpha/beta-hydrolase [Mycena albidolilacea]